MKRLLAVLVLSGVSVNAQTITETFGSGANQFSIEFVTIGNPGNTADAGVDNHGYRLGGSVSYIYNIGKYEISRDAVMKADAAGQFGIGLADMTSYGGNGLNRPATGMSWNEAARFVNWLNTSKGYQPAYNLASTVNRSMSPWSAGQYSGDNQFRHKDAYFFLPNLDEWYKAAYGSSTGAWYDYPTGPWPPTGPSKVAGGTDEGTAVWGLSSGAGPADIANAGGLSPFGTMGQGGNVREFLEVTDDQYNSSFGEERHARGGTWSGDYLFLKNDYRSDRMGLSGNAATGFRVASVPEPSSLSLLLAGGAVLMAGRRRMPR